MFGFLFFILLLPPIIYGATRLLLEEDHKFRMFMHNWIRSSLFYVGMLLGCIGKTLLPCESSTKDSLEGLSHTDSFSKGIKTIWK
jgi:hypothetical protein